MTSHTPGYEPDYEAIVERLGRIAWPQLGESARERLWAELRHTLPERPPSTGSSPAVRE